MKEVLSWLESAVATLPLPLLEVWGRLAFIVGFGLALAAYGGFTFRPGGRWGLGRERQAWNGKALLAILLTFLSILTTGYLGSFIVLVPGAQTLESLKDLMVFLCIVLFGYPALLTVPFAYGLSDLIEGVPPAFLLDWLPGYFINPTCFWLAYQLIGRDPDFRKLRTWGLYLVFVLSFLWLEPVLWGYLCSDQFTPAISYHNITSALFFTTGLTWLLAPPAMLAAYPLARRLGMFWAFIPGHVREKPLGARDWTWESGRPGAMTSPGGAGRGWPIRLVILAPFLTLMLLMVGGTAFVTLKSAGLDAKKLAVSLHEEISRNIDLRLDDHLSRAPLGGDRERGIAELLKGLPIADNGLALVLDGSGRILASSAQGEAPVASQAVSELGRLRAGTLPEEPLGFQFDHVTEKPLGRATWLAQATPYQDRTGGRKGWTLLTLMPESYYLAGVMTGNSRSAMVFALSLLLVLGAASLLGAWVTGGLRRLSQATVSLARGDLSQRVKESRMAELNDLSRSFNNMTDRLSQTIAQLREEVGRRKDREKRLEQSEESLKASRERLQLAVKAAALGIWDWDVERDLLVWDDSMYPLYGVDRKDFGGAYEAWMNCLHPDDLSRAQEDVQAALKGQKEFDTEFRIRLKNGTTRVIRGMAQVVRAASGRPLRMVGVNWDATKQVESERILLEEARVLEMIASGVPLPKVLETIVLAIEAISKDVQASILLLDPDGAHLRKGAAPNLPAAYNRAIEGRPIGEKAGSCGTAAHRGEAVIVTDIQTDPLWEDYRELAQEHGLKACWSTPIKDAKGKVLGTFAMYYREARVPRPENLTLIQRATHLAGVAIEKRRAEEDRVGLEEQFHQAQKMEAVGHLAGGIAHDFNNMLTAILGFAKFIRDDLDPKSPRLADVEQIVSISGRATALTRQLLTFSRKQVLQPALLDLNRCVEESRKLLRPLLGEDIQLDLRLDQEPVRCMADPGQLQQALLNLAVNARDAMPDGGKIQVATRSIVAGREATRANPDAKPGAYAQVSVSDQGTGMPPEVLSRIFEPFFTTKGVGKGTGLGLPVVYGVVQQSGGFIEVESRMGMGTTFKLNFPSAEGPVAELAKPKEEKGVQGGKETVLVVEDEDTLREISRRVLSAHGYKVLTAPDGLEALRIIDAHPDPIDLMVTDVVMPRMSGPALAETVHQSHPEMPILFLSGHADDITARYGLPVKGSAFLGKPYSLDDLIRKVREVLDSPKKGEGPTPA